MTQLEAVVGIELQEPSGGACGSRETTDSQPFPNEVPRPHVASRIEEPHDAVRVRIYSRQVCALALVASGACPSRFAGKLETSMTSCPDMLQMETHQLRQQVRKLAPRRSFALMLTRREPAIATSTAREAESGPAPRKF